MIRSLLSSLLVSGAVVVLLLLRRLVALPAVGSALPSEKLFDFVQATMDSYYRLTELVTLTFGAVAFLVSYQERSGLRLHERSWSFLAAGLICLTAALVLALVSREVIVEMIGNNAIDLSYSPLRFGRWGMYALLLAGIGLLGAFALDVALGRKGETGQSGTRR